MRTTRLIAAAAGAIALVVAAGAAYATIPDANGVIHGCMKKSGGALRVIDSGVTQCSKDETALSWNRTGPQGPQGLQGAPGAQGVQGDPGPQGAPGAASVLIVPFIVDAAAFAWTNMPSADTLLNGSHRHVTRVDLTNFTQCRLVVNKQSVAGGATSKIRLVYATTFQTVPANYLAIGASEVAASPLNVQNAIVASAWINLVAGAKADVFLALIGSGGDGALDPTFGSIVAQFR